MCETAASTSAPGERLARATRALADLEGDRVTPDQFATVFDQVLLAADDCARSSEDIPLEQLSVVRRLLSTSSLVRRLQTWPRGYQGDFETIHRLVEGRNQERPGTFAHASEEWALRCPPAQQHRNKVRLQSALIASTFMRVPEPRILSVASGPNCDLRLAADAIDLAKGKFVLNDADADAVAFSTATLPGSVVDRSTFLPGSIFRSIRQVARHGPYDLILVGGLFDYLTDRRCAWLLQHLSGLLHASGTLYFSNVRSGHPYKVCMEQVGSWLLRERSAEELVALLPPEMRASCRVSRDATGIGLLATATRSRPS